MQDYQVRSEECLCSEWACVQVVTVYLSDLMVLDDRGVSYLGVCG